MLCASREDSFASTGFCGLAAFVAALLKCLEAQARGFAHGHGNVKAALLSTECGVEQPAAPHELGIALPSVLSYHQLRNCLQCLLSLAWKI